METDAENGNYAREDEARKAEIVERRRQTRQENLERQRLQEEQLANETKGGRPAKRLAQENAVWKPEKTSKRDKQSSASEKNPRNKSASSDRRQVEKSANLIEGPREQEPVQKGSQRARTNTNSTNSRHDVATKKSVKTKETHRKRHSKTPVEESDVEDSEDTTASSSAGDERSDFNSADGGGDNNDDDDDEINKELELPRFARSDLLNTKGARNLFDNDDNVEISSHHRSSSRSGTLPPTTDDDDNFDRISIKSRYSSGVDNDEDRPRKRTRTSSSASSRRMDKEFDLDAEDESLSASESRSSSLRHAPRKAPPQKRLEKRFDDERPRVKPAVPDATKAKSVVPTTEEVSPEVRIVRNGTAKLRLLDQPVTLQGVIREAIEQATEDVMLRKAWPEEDAWPTYGRDRLLDACRAPGITKTYDGDHLRELKMVLKKDLKAAKLLGSLVTGRLSVIRASIKVEALKAVPHYQLGLGSNCSERVKSLLNDFVFHMPGAWGGETQNQWIPSGKEAFLGPALIATIKEAYFSTPQSLGGRFLHRFESKLGSKPDEKELPASLLALGMTGLYCALYEYRNGHKEDADFDGSTFLAVNEEIVHLLERLRNDKPIQFHDRMHQLYRLICDPSKNVPVIHTGAYTVIEF